MITINATGDTTIRTAGKYCEEDILIKVPESEGVELPELSNEGTALDLLSGKELIDGSGNIVTGTMINNEAVSQTLDVNTTSYTIPQGYHSGFGEVSIITETKSVTPTKSVQTISPTSGKVLSSVSVEAIPSKYQDVSEVTANSPDVLSGKKFVNSSGTVLTGIIPTRTASNLTVSGATVTIPAGYYASQATKAVSTATQATPSISVDSSGKITASATQTAGYVSAGTKSATQQLNTQAAKTITPTTSNQTIAAGTYLTGVQTIKGDSNLKAENIKSGISIFGVDGTLTEDSGGIDTSDATATADKIFLDETAYVDGEKVTGTFTIDNEISSQDNLISRLRGALNGKAGNGLETYTLTVSIEGLDYDAHVICTTLNNGVIGRFIKTFRYEDGQNQYFVIENVICGSSVIVYDDDWYDCELENIERVDYLDLGSYMRNFLSVYCKQNNLDSNTASITLINTLAEEEW